MLDEKLPIVEAMINYLYCGIYDDQVALESKASDDDLQVGLPWSPPKPVTEPFGDLRQNKAGSGYTVPQVVPSPTKPSSLLFNAKVCIIADKYMIPALKSLAHEKFKKSLRKHWNTPEFTAATEFLWENTPGSDTLLRRAVIATAAKYMDVLLDKEEFVDFMSEYGEFTVDVMKRMKGKDK